MAKKPRAHDQSATTRKVLIIFSAVIIIAAAALIWNNRSLSYAGTLDGQRLPLAQFEFFANSWMEELWQMGIGDSPDLAISMAWSDLVDMHLTVNQASALGVVLTDEDFVRVDEIIERNNSIYTIETPQGSVNLLTEWGFSNASFRRFVEMMVLQGKVFDYVTSYVTVDEAEFQAAFEEFLDEHYLDIRAVLVNYIEVESQDHANFVFSQFVQGIEFVQLMREHSLYYDPEFLMVDEEGNTVEWIDIRATAIGMDFEQLLAAYAMEIGEVSPITELANGNFAFFEVVDIEDMDRDELESFFRFEFEGGFEGSKRTEYFNNTLLIWRQDANIAQNSRIFN